MSYRRDIAKNVVSLLVGGLVGKVCRFLAVVALANALGTETFGVLAAVLGAAFIISMAADFGLSHLGTRELARSPEARADLVADLCALKAVLIAVACGLLLLASRLLPLPEDVSLLVAISAVVVLTHEVVFEWVFEGSGRTELLGVYRVLLNGAFLAAVLLYVRGPDDVALVPLIDAGASFLGFLVCVLLWPGVWRYARGRPSVSRWPGLLKNAAPFGLANFLTLAIPSVGVFVLIAFASPAETGMFKAAGTIVFGLLSVGFLIGRAVYPVLSRIARSSPESARDVLAPVFRLICALSLPAALGGTMLASAFVRLLYEPAYAPATSVLAILLWSLPMALITVTIHYTLLAFGDERHRALGLVLQLVFEVAVGIPLVVRFGYIGAGAAHLAGQVVALVYAVWRLSRVRQVPVLRYALKPALACLALAAAVYPLADLHLAFPVLAGAGAYVLILVAIGGIRASEISSVVRLIVSSPE